MRSFLAASAATRPLPARVSAICVMAARGGFRAEAEIAGATGQNPALALLLLERDVLSGGAVSDIDEFVRAQRAQEIEPGRHERAAWLSPNET